MIGKLIPFGYSVKGSEALLHSLMSDAHTLLIDTRYTPYCGWNNGKNMWQQAALQEQYGKRYHYAGKFLGNVNHNKKNADIKLAHPSVGIRGLLMYLHEGYNLILLCACREYSTCHRHVLVELVKGQLPEVEIVQPDAITQPDIIKALSIRQPYASWLANPQWFLAAGVPPKRIENRDWNTSYRGPLLIHASSTFEDDAFDYWSYYCDGLEDAVPMHKEAYPAKCIVGIATLSDVVTESSDLWFCGNYGFMLENARPLEPFPYRGQLNLFDIPVEVVRERLER